MVYAGAHSAGMEILDQVRQKLRAGHYAYRTEQAYVHWIERYVRWHAERIATGAIRKRLAKLT